MQAGLAEVLPPPKPKAPPQLTAAQRKLAKNKDRSATMPSLSQLGASRGLHSAASSPAAGAKAGTQNAVLYREKRAPPWPWSCRWYDRQQEQRNALRAAGYQACQAKLEAEDQAPAARHAGEHDRAPAGTLQPSTASEVYRSNCPSPPGLPPVGETGGST